MTARLHLAGDGDLPPAPVYGEPVSFDFADGPVDLGTEDRDGQRVLRLALEDGLAHLALYPAEVRRLAVEMLLRLADQADGCAA
jgi:hypothetical protein